MSEKILVIGLGFLGKTLLSTTSEFGLQTTGTHKSTLDVCNRDSIEKIINNYKPDFIVNCAAHTNIEQIESNSEIAYAVNAYGAKNVAIIAQKNKIKLIHISTDSVFDGIKGMYKEEDLPNPINEYSKSKKLGEDFVKEVSDEFIIVRTNFYGYDTGGKFLFNWIVDNLHHKQAFIGFNDVIFNPLEIKNLSSMIIELFYTKFTGLIHLSSNEVMSKYEFAKKVADILNLDHNLIRKGSVNDAHFVAKRPLNTSLDNIKSRKLLKTTPLTLEEWLKNQFRQD